MNTTIRKVKHKGRRHFMERANGPYAWGIDERISQNIKQEPRYGQRKSGGRTNPGRRTKRELQNAAERSDKE